MSEIVEGHERETIRAEAEIEIRSYMHAVEAPTESRVKHGMGRHRRPTAVISGRSPNHPRWRPNCIRHPNPAASVVHLPSAIMERRPTPRIVRLPIPTAIRIEPMPAVAVRPPAVIDQNGSRLRAPTDPSQFHPCAVWREIAVKIIRLRWWRAGVCWRRLFLNGWQRWFLNRRDVIRVRWSFISQHCVVIQHGRYHD